MGRQIEFYFSEDDEQEFLRQIESAEITFLRFRELVSVRYEEVRLAEFSETSGSEQQVLICHRSDLECLKYWGSASDMYMVNILDSPVIEFSRSGLTRDSNRLLSGRLYYEHRYWTKDAAGNDVIMEKSEELEKLYSRLVRWIKKYCKRLPGGYYIGPHAMKLHQNGAELSG
jgi:hypothetical protein